MSIQVEDNTSTIIIAFICPLNSSCFLMEKKYGVLLQNMNFGSENFKRLSTYLTMLYSWKIGTPHPDYQTLDIALGMGYFTLVFMKRMFA